MNFNKNAKVLFLTGVDQELPQLLQQMTNINIENMMTLQVYGPEIAQPYGDLMRAIILAIYQGNVEEVVVVGTTDDQRRDVRAKLVEQDGIQEKAKTVDFLFTRCMPEFPGITLDEWLQGSKTVTDSVQKSVKLLREHPLLPSGFTVHGLLMDKEKGELTEVKVS
jgi:carbonic anhydrase